MPNSDQAFESSLTWLRVLVEKDLNEFIAIQRWKDTNFYARKEAATRVRRQLFKFVKTLKSKVDLAVVDFFKQCDKIDLAPLNSISNEQFNSKPSSFTLFESRLL